MIKKYLHDEYSNDEIFWDKNWENILNTYSHTILSVDPKLVHAIMKHLVKPSRILEGGCGLSQYVRYFANHGFQIVGIDFAHETVHKINQAFPELDVRTGNIRALQFADNEFDAYFSGGVVEHFEDGLQPQLSEAYRVLKDRGLLFVTVPFANITRRIAYISGKNRYRIDMDGRKAYVVPGVHTFQKDEPPVGYHFHEYTFTTNEMQRYLTQSKFIIIDEVSYSAYWGILDLTIFRKVHATAQPKRYIWNRAFGLILKALDYFERKDSMLTSWISYLTGACFGNMKLYVCTVSKS